MCNGEGSRHIILDEVLSQRGRINELICTRLAQEAVKVANVEMREIEPPADIQQAMTQQMSLAVLIPRECGSQYGVNIERDG